MATIKDREALDALVRRVQQAIAGDWPSEGGMRHPGVKPSPALVAALATAEAANDSGLEVEAALAGLQAVWAPEVLPEAPAAPPEW